MQYFYYMQGILTGDLGTTFSGQQVSDILARTFPVTFRLAVMAIIIESVFGILIGLIAGLRKNGIFDTVSLLLSLVSDLDADLRAGLPRAVRLWHPTRLVSNDRRWRCAPQ